MTDESTKPVVWLGDTRKRVKEFPDEVQKHIGVALYDAQRGEKPPTAKPFKGVGSGVFEIVTRFDANTWRTVYAAQIGKRLYVLHAFQKKSPKGIKTAKKDEDLIHQRYKLALQQEKA